jgi:DNA-directed RNA polymerase
VSWQHKQTDNEIKRAFSEGTMQQHVSAVNRLQDVPFRINERVLDAVKLYGEKLSCQEIREKLLRKKFRNESDRKRELRRQPIADKANLELAIATAEDYRGAPFYVPMHCDWRGRVLGIPHFNFQREDRVRALFLFDRGASIDIEKDHPSRKALLRHVANTGGFEGIDKKSFIHHASWVYKNWELIEQTALGKAKDG